MLIRVASCILGIVITTTINVDDDGCVRACLYVSESVVKIRKPICRCHVVVRALVSASNDIMFCVPIYIYICNECTMYVECSHNRCLLERTIITC